MATGATRPPQVFDPAAFEVFRFVARELHADGRVTLGYALDDEVSFVEELVLPLPGPLHESDLERVDGLLSLLHWVAGVSYYKAAASARIACESGDPPPAAAALLEALYCEGLGEFAYTNALAGVPRPRFPRAAGSPGRLPDPAGTPRRVLVPVGGGKDSVVALEIVRRAGVGVSLFSIGDPPPIARTVAVAGLPRLLAERRLDPLLLECNRAGALNGHVPVTAIVAVAALLTAALWGFDAVALANERSASSPSLTWDGVEINHQFSKSRRVELLLREAAREVPGCPEVFSVLRPASELAIARAFAGMTAYHPAFTSCNTIFRIDPALRRASWCCDCPKCRFVFLALAPFSEPAHLVEVFGADMLDDERQFEGFALLTATGGHKPFECVGEEAESLAAIRLLAGDPRWRSRRVVARLVAEVLPAHPEGAGDPAAALALLDEHSVPGPLLDQVRAVLGP